jgi:uncharacterized MAPEG superfamily protein
MEGAVGSTELSVLGWSVVLLLLQVLAQATAASDLGPTYLFSPRDERRESRSVIAGRLARALNNLLETYPAFVALALGLIVAGKTGGLGATGAWVWIAARVLYVFIYATGIPVVRTLVWLVSIIGLLLMLVRLMA